MSLQKAAKYLESHGRGNDTMLVHMTPNEVRGLHALAKASGGALSINPDTGLTEAGWLDKLLPTIAGVGLSMIPGVGPMMAAGIVGGAETLRTGDLGKGLMAGLGAYGGAGMAQGLSAAGGVTPGMEAGAKAIGTDAASISSTEGMTKALSDSTGAIDPTKTQAFGDAYSQAAKPSLMNMGRGFGDVETAWANAPKGTGLSLTGTALNLASPEVKPPPEKEEDPRYKTAPYRMNLASDYRATNPLTAPNYYRPIGLGYAEGGVAEAPQTDFFPQSQINPTQYATPTQMPGSREVINADFDAAVNPYNGSPRMLASGGVAGYANEGVVKHLPRSAGMPDTGVFRDYDPDTSKKSAFDAAQVLAGKAAKSAGLKAVKLPKTNVKGLGDISNFTDDIQSSAAGGSIGGYSDGGRMLKGPGDGMSDSIPATIGKKQPARLADGEFVVPADVVSHLGNGSTDAGAKRLYSMMDKVRKARTGKKKQAPAVKADRYLPA